MKIIVAILSLSFLWSCTGGEKEKIAPDGSADTLQNRTVATSLQQDIDTAILYLDTTTINGKKYTALYKSQIFYVIAGNADTIVNRTGVHPQFEFEDFDGDRFKDIRIPFVTNVPGIQDLFLYDKNKNAFRFVENFQNFPAAEPVRGTRYYYSYTRMGCADKNWDSDLFYIENYKAIRLGNIEGRECGDTGTKDGIYIHKVGQDEKMLVKSLPISMINRYKKYKWGFIKEYWTKNYKHFL